MRELRYEHHHQHHHHNNNNNTPQHNTTTQEGKESLQHKKLNLVYLSLACLPPPPYAPVDLNQTAAVMLLIEGY